MSPTPISLLDNSLTPVMYRNAWETGQSDLLPRKLVGGHLPLSKRNSTPVGMGIGVNPHYPSLKMNISQQNHQLLPVPQVVNPAPASDILTSTHRPLDRCHSEPVGPSQSVTGAGTASSRYKTELCRPYAETGFCKYGEKCQFAHGDPELRGLPRHPKYKTELCRTFHTTGLCGYGTRCHFIHNADERQHGAPMQQGPCLTGDEPPFLLLQQQQQQSLSPPASLHGSPRSSGGAFFGDSFCTSPFAVPFEDTTTTASSPFPLLGLDTPPVSPVESLAGDIENLSLSPSLSDSPPPGLCSAIGGHLTTSSSSTAAAAAAIMDPQRYLRLPIFQSLKEAL